MSYAAMAGKLEQYQAKRNFRRTSEPKGRIRRRKKQLLFVVQKHAASHLHYDFRLELDGSLLSWAMPKGPSLDSRVRRLAVQVENHPIEYADFEGIIPARQYGGGTVMIWDKGTWTPEGDARKACKKGHLSFQLNGQRLQGGWSLIRTSIGDDARQWLLIKRSDQYATGKNIEQHTTSVISRRTMEEIRSNSDRVWETADAPEAPVPARLPGARKRTMPEMFTVEKAQLSTTVPEGSDWLHEIKYDGYRLLAFVRGRNIRLLTQRGNNWTNRFPSVREALRSLNLKSAILDGETTVLTAQGTTDFQKLQNALHGKHAGPDMVFFVFDVPYFNGYDLTHTPLILRKEALKSILMRSGTDSVLQYSEHVRGKGKEFFDFSCGSGLEGVVSKKADSFYRQERSNDWLKIKCRQRQEFVIGGFTDPAGDRAGFGALLLGVYDDDGKLKYCGKMGTGFTQSSLMEIHRLLKKSEQRNTAFADPPRAAGVHWTAPVLVAEVEFREWTDENRVRMAAFKGLREDKSPRSVHREKAAAEPVQKRKQEKNVVAGVHLSHPQKIMFPDQSLTKQDLAEYYERVAEWILPHIVNRPLMLVRCPEGQNSACFHQKHVMPSMPDSIRSATMMDKGESARLICIDDLRGLIALVQLGTLEFHPWGSPADHPETPDRLIFDLDPSEQVNWPDVMAAARSLRDLLAALELKAFVRTTGGKGLHVVCPLHGRLAWQTVKAFSGAVAHEMVRAYPEQYIATMNKRARAGKIFIDYFRNERGATAIASYSTRAREGAPVAAPLAWSELRPALKRDQLTAFRLPRRLGALKTDPWEGFMESGQTLNKTALRAMGVK